MNPSPHDDSEEIKNSLFSNVEKSNWEGVIKTYQQNQAAHTTKITNFGDTALHVAISDGKESIVKALVAAACKTRGALETKNELGYTPLHLAAHLGNAMMCRCIAKNNTALMGIRNDDNDTPFFLTVLHGRKEAFHALHSVCGPEEGYNYCRGKEGETILHSAISGEYFDLAFEIMNHYKKLMNAVNEQGYTPLHILANKPAIFRSGSHIRGLDKLIYHLGQSNVLHDEENTRDQQPDEEHRHVISTRANAEQLQFKGWKAVEKIRVQKAKHSWSILIMNKLLDHASWDQYEYNGKRPDISEEKRTELMDVNPSTEEQETMRPILIAAKNGVVEMIEGILDRFPLAIHDMNSEEKNVVLLAVEHRQPHVYKFLLDWKITKETIFRKTDKDGNSALHLAARLGEYRPWLIPGAALQMQWEIKWYEFVRDSMPSHFFSMYNRKSKTPTDIFKETHKDLAKEGGAWLTNISQSCSVVAGLIATVVFPNSATIPGGVKSDNSGTPTLQNEAIFNIYAISSLVAFCFSVNSVIMFLVILTSSYQGMDFRTNLPRKLLVGLTSLFISIGCMLLSFCAGHFFVVKEKLHYGVIPMYLISCLPVVIYAVVQFPFYFDLVWGIMRKVPGRRSINF